MPAQPLSSVPTNIACSDIVGTYASNADGFVDHVGIAKVGREGVRKGDALTVAEMGPPLSDRAEWSPDVHGTATLTYGESMQIALFCRQHRRKHEANNLVRGMGPLRGYTIHPHCKPFCEEDGTPVGMRFSCVGFVVEAYREAGIDLIATAWNELPRASWKSLSVAYSMINKPEWAMLNAKYGLGLDPRSPEWRVVLPGYVLNALARSNEDIRASRYTPNNTDARFPH